MGNRRARAVAAALTVMFAVGLVAAPAAAAPVTRVVDDDGHASATSCGSDRRASRTIQRAIDRAGQGDTILVCPGVYRERLLIEGTGKNGLRLRSVRPLGAVVRKPPPTSDAAVLPAEGVVQIEIFGARNVRVIGFKVVSPTATPCSIVHDAIRVGPGGDGAVIQGNSVVAGGSDTLGALNDCGFNVGIAVYESEGATVSGNTVKDFRSTGIHVQNSQTSVDIADNTVSFHHATQPAGTTECTIGIRVFEGPTGRVLDNEIVGLASAGSTTPLLCTGIYLDQAGPGLAVRRNLVRHADYGIEVDYGTGAKVVRNELRSVRSFGIYLYDEEDTLVRTNLVRGYAINGIWASLYTEGATFDGNDVAGPGATDCKDESTGGTPGAPTYGTQNTWTDNTGAVGDPTGICAP